MHSLEGLLFSCIPSIVYQSQLVLVESQLTHHEAATRTVSPLGQYSNCRDLPAGHRRRPLYRSKCGFRCYLRSGVIGYVVLPKSSCYECWHHWRVHGGMRTRSIMPCNHVGQHWHLQFVQRGYWFVQRLYRCSYPPAAIHVDIRGIIDDFFCGGYIIRRTGMSSWHLYKFYR